MTCKGPCACGGHSEILTHETNIQICLMKNVISSANIFCSCRFEVCLFHCCICIVSSSSDPFDKDVTAKCSSTLYMEGWSRWDFYPLSLWLINNTLTEKCIVLQTQCGTISTSLNMQVTPLATCAHFHLVLSLGCAWFCGPFGLVHPVESSRCNYFTVFFISPPHLPITYTRTRSPWGPPLLLCIVLETLLDIAIKRVISI